MNKNIREEQLKKVQLFVQNKGGKCISTTYVNRTSHLLIECEKGHQWNVTWDTLNKGHWCPICNEYYIPHAFEEIEQIVQSKKGSVILLTQNSDGYVRQLDRIRLTCEFGHQWETSVQCVRHGAWCHTCARSNAKKTRDNHYNQKRIDFAIQIATKNNGVYEANENNIRFYFTCKEGHSFMRNYQQLKNEMWCPVCNIITRVSLRKTQFTPQFNLINKYCEKFHWKIISYINYQTPMIIQCKNGHQHTILPKTIKQKMVCSDCIILHQN